MKLLNNGLMIAFLVMLSACSSTQEPASVTRTVVQTKYVYVTPPEEYLSNCNIDIKQVAGNASLLAYAQYLEFVIDKCNENIKRTKQWASEFNNG